MKHFYHFLMILFIFGFTNQLYSQSVPSYVPTNGLVGWWGFNGNAQDGSGNGNHGTVNGATLTTDRFGNQNGAYYFSSSGCATRIDVNVNTSTIQTGLTMSVWVMNVGTGCINPRLLEFYQNTDGPGMSWWGTDYNQGLWSLGSNTSTGFLCYSTIPMSANNVWAHLVYTNNGSVGNFYKDGILISTVNSTGNPILIGSGAFGRMNHPAFDAYNGKLDDIGIWNRALTQQEITNLYTSQLPTQTSLCLPSITTNTPTSIGIDSLIVGGNITNDGGSSIVLRGVCYSTTPNPNMGNMRTEDGAGVGSFSTILRNLNPSTTYYVRSYAKNTNGVVVYGDEVIINTMSTPLIGSNYAGGIVFYVDSTGAHGLVCAPYDLGNWLLGEYYWGCYGLDIQNTSTNVGSGAINTLLITAGCTQRPIAASVCADFVLNGYSDWYLPSLGELQLIFNNLHSQGIGGLSGYLYWSSSQSIPDGAWIMLFNNPNGGLGSVINHTKDYGASVRPTRTF